jgi:phosphoserine phosphatase
MAVIAVIFDFDDTLVPDSTSALLEAHGINAQQFWTTDARRLVEEEGYDPPLAYLKLLLDEVGPGKRLGELTNAKLAEFGATLDDKWFPGLPEIFDDLRDIVSKGDDVSIEFYINSGGLQALIQGSSHVQKYFRGVYGCQLAEDETTGLVKHVKRCVTFTEKTRFLFEINKGIRQDDAASRPHLVNEALPDERRRIPFENMIYVGDGQTDIPCFSLVEKNKGRAFGVFQPNRESARQAFQRFLDTKRVHAIYRPDYREDSDLGAVLRTAVAVTTAAVEFPRTL